ncbi:uncharacterized protein LOC131314791 isoform X2 [Rhododendron vialii]|uniref:uncharacterized protein LOC131314791 isoform X2 n=1 Tax=Rhododendron vialii TaxID=182163 RepID=UPI00265F7C75|nr:uncharacterized protein LOC131314791 isoform X2 [Rhododendron vialii]
MSQLSNLYLFAYNSIQALGWAISISRILSNFVSTKSFSGAYASAGELICLLQTVAFVEVVHGAIGIVPSGVLLPLMQWGGRVHFLLAIVRRINEVIRYPHYALNCVGSSLSLVTYLRYTAFILLYPMGLAGEMWLMYQALPLIKTKNLYAYFFAGLPITYYDFVKVLLACYPFMWLKLYLHLFKQRKAKLGKQHKKKRN